MNEAGSSTALRSTEITVGALMSKRPLFVHETTWASRVWALLTERELTWTPIVDDRGHPVGLVLREDLTPFALSDDVDPLGETPPPYGTGWRVGHLMSEEVLVLRLEAPASKARAVCLRTRAPGVAVVDEQGVLAGVVASEDLCALAPPPRPACVLVVDDDRDVRETLGELLVDEGFEVVLAENGRAALAAVSAMKPDVMLLDLMMPVMSGWDLLDEVAHDPDAYRGLPIIVISDLARPLSPTQRTTVAACFHKPFEIAGLVAAVSTHSAATGQDSPPPAPTHLQKSPTKSRADLE